MCIYTSVARYGAPLTQLYHAIPRDVESSKKEKNRKTTIEDGIENVRRYYHIHNVRPLRKEHTSLSRFHDWCWTVASNTLYSKCSYFTPRAALFGLWDLPCLLFHFSFKLPTAATVGGSLGSSAEPYLHYSNK